MQILSFIVDEQNDSMLRSVLVYTQSNRQPSSCDLSSVVALDFNKLSAGIREILYYRVWSLVERIFWEGIVYTH